jgi:hypothetical protein
VHRRRRRAEGEGGAWGEGHEGGMRIRKRNSRGRGGRREKGEEFVPKKNANLRNILIFLALVTKYGSNYQMLSALYPSYNWMPWNFTQFPKVPLPSFSTSSSIPPLLRPFLYSSSSLLPPSSFLLPPSSFLLPPSSFLLPPSSFLLPPSSFLLPPSSLPLLPLHFPTLSHFVRACGKKTLFSFFTWTGWATS